MKFNKDEISLCKQLSELGVRKEIKWDDRVIYENQEWVVIHYFRDPVHPVIKLANDKNQIEQIYRESKLLPLWQTHDCLEWLREHSYYLERLGQNDESWWCVWIYETDDMGIIEANKYHSEGKTPLEALLKAMIAIAKEQTNATTKQ